MLLTGSIKRALVFPNSQQTREPPPALPVALEPSRLFHASARRGGGIHCGNPAGPFRRRNWVQSLSVVAGGSARPSFAVPRKRIYVLVRGSRRGAAELPVCARQSGRRIHPLQRGQIDRLGPGRRHRASPTSIVFNSPPVYRGRAARGLSRARGKASACRPSRALGLRRRGAGQLHSGPPRSRRPAAVYRPLPLRSTTGQRRFLGSTAAPQHWPPREQRLSQAQPFTPGPITRRLRGALRVAMT